MKTKQEIREYKQNLIDRLKDYQGHYDYITELQITDIYSQLRLIEWVLDEIEE